MNAKRFLRGPLFWILLPSCWSSSVRPSSVHRRTERIDTSQAVADIQANSVESAVITDGDQVLELTLKDARRSPASTSPVRASSSRDCCRRRPPRVNSPRLQRHRPQDNIFLSLLFTLLPFALLILLLFFFMSQMQGGGRIMNFGKSKAKAVSKDMPKTTFADVAGADEAVEELEEIKEFLSEPAKFRL